MHVIRANAKQRAPFVGVIAGLILAFLAPSAFAQFTTVTGTVTDPNGLPYAFGTIASVIVSSSTPVFSSNSQPYFQPIQATGLDKNGVFVVRLADNTQLSPGGTTWSFTVCSAVGTVQPAFGKGPICFVVTGVTISGASQDIGATLSAAALPLTVAFGGAASCPGCTANTLTMWTGAALANSPVTTNAGGLFLNFGSGGTPLSQGNAILSNFILASSGTCGGTNTIPNPGIGCKGLQAFNQPVPTSGTGVLANFVSLIKPAAATTAALYMAGYFGISNQGGGGGTTATEERTLYVENTGLGSLPTTRRGEYIYTANSVTNGTTATQEGLVIDNRQTGTGNTITNDYGAHILSPTVSAGTLTNHTGLQIEDQTAAAGGTNSNPLGINEANATEKNNLGTVALGAHLNQQAASRFAGTCTMVGAATCTFTIGAAFVGTPVAVCSIDQASTVPATANSCKCSVSSTTVTITAGASNSLAWDCILVGNPN